MITTLCIAIIRNNTDTINATMSQAANQAMENVHFKLSYVIIDMQTQISIYMDKTLFPWRIIWVLQNTLPFALEPVNTYCFNR